LSFPVYFQTSRCAALFFSVARDEEVITTSFILSRTFSRFLIYFFSVLVSSRSAASARENVSPSPSFCQSAF
ncbi:MAG: hypothetical protein MJ178_06325, partial [Treponemataceae bacterium]|nr:hypothetical protein [Treponemataceae bacterium]